MPEETQVWMSCTEMPLRHSGEKYKDRNITRSSEEVNDRGLEVSCIEVLIQATVAVAITQVKYM